MISHPLPTDLSYTSERYRTLLDETAETTIGWQLYVDYGKWKFILVVCLTGILTIPLLSLLNRIYLDLAQRRTLEQLATQLKQKSSSRRDEPERLNSREVQVVAEMIRRMQLLIAFLERREISYDRDQLIAHFKEKISQNLHPTIKTLVYAEIAKRLGRSPEEEIVRYDQSSTPINQSPSTKALPRRNRTRIVQEGNDPDEISVLKSNSGLTISYIYAKLSTVPDLVLMEKTLQVLLLQHNSIKSLPDALYSLPLVVLNISNNQIEEVSPAITKCVTLQELDISDNGFTSLEGILSLPNLCKLEAGKNKIKELSDSGSPKLRDLNLSNNPLSSAEISRISNLQLRTLSLRLIGLYTLPDELAGCTTMCKLDLYQNKLSSIPKCIFALTKLESLNLSYNELTTIPADLNSLKKLTQFLIDWNEIRKIEELESFETLPLNEFHINRASRRIIGFSKAFSERLGWPPLDDEQPEDNTLNSVG